MLPRQLKFRLTSAQRRAIAAEFEGGAYTTELTEEYDLGKGALLKLLAEEGVKMRRQALSAKQVRGGESPLRIWLVNVARRCAN